MALVSNLIWYILPLLLLQLKLILLPLPWQQIQLGKAWYLDSGATNHVTSEMQNLSTRNDYKGKEKLIVGNGSTLNISHIDDSFIHIPNHHKPLHLHVITG